MPLLDTEGVPLPAELFDHAKTKAGRVGNFWVSESVFKDGQDSNNVQGSSKVGQIAEAGNRGPANRNTFMYGEP
jgi:hypothetical protein